MRPPDTFHARNLRLWVALLTVLGALALPMNTWPADENSIAYKMAILHARAEQPEDVFLQKRIVPSDAVASEFQWILDTMKTKCLNPETAIADTIVETWQTLRNNGYDLTLLETARELSRAAQNAALQDDEKINFRMTSLFWLKKKLETPPS